MSPKEVLRCSCGGRIERPLPSHCPHCGRQIVGVRRIPLSGLFPLLIVGAMFAALVAFVAWWAGRW
jgi:hypothetical protein